MGTGCKSNKSIVHTRITDSGQEGNNSAGLYYMENQVWLRWGPRLVLIPDTDTGTDARVPGGVVSPKF